MSAECQTDRGTLCGMRSPLPWTARHLLAIVAICVADQRGWIRAVRPRRLLRLRRRAHCHRTGFRRPVPLLPHRLPAVCRRQGRKLAHGLSSRRHQLLDPVLRADEGKRQLQRAARAEPSAGQSWRSGAVRMSRDHLVGTWRSVDQRRGGVEPPDISPQGRVPVGGRLLGLYEWDHWVREIRHAFPADEYPIFDVPPEHPIFRTQFEVQRHAADPEYRLLHALWRRRTSEQGADSAVPHLRAIADKRGRIIVLITHNTDIGDSWEREGRRPGLLHVVRAERIRARDQRLPLRADPLTPLRPHLLVAGLLLCPCASAFAQGSDDTRTQYPRLLQNSYIAINVGAVDQPFSQQQLQPGFRAASIDVPRDRRARRCCSATSSTGSSRRRRATCGR